MSNSLLSVCGIDADTGQYIIEDFTPARAVELARATDSELFSEGQKRAIRALSELDAPHMGPVAGVDARLLSESGWGILFAAADPEADQIKEALKPLLDLRREQAGDRFKDYSKRLGYKSEYQHAENWLNKRGGSVHDSVDPKKVPYYLLIVGSPETIPYRFQYELDMQYAVGRIHFDSIEEYEAYAQAVVEAETGVKKRSARIAMFAPKNGGADNATILSAECLVKPLGDSFSKAFPSWEVERLVGKEESDETLHATKPNLRRLLSDDSRPALLFTASHGLSVNSKGSRMRDRQGALVCQEWPGVKGKVDPSWYFSGDDVTPDLQMQGLITFSFACYSAGTPVRDNFGGKKELADFTAGDDLDPRISNEAFVARLPQRLLANGALAAVGHVERAFPESFAWRGNVRINEFESALTELANNYPVGHALDRFGRRYTALATQLFERLLKPKPNAEKVAELWVATTDARNYVIVGDPAVRLNV